MFNPKYYGSAFNCICYDGESKNASSFKCHLLTDSKGFNLVSNDWNSIEQRVNSADVEGVELRKKLIAIKLRPGSKPNVKLFDTKPDPPDKLLDALQIMMTEPAKEHRFLALPVILPTFNFSDRSMPVKLHKNIMDACAQVLQTFRSPVTINGAFVDVFSCLYRIRFTNSSAVNIEKNITSLSNDFKRQLIIIYGSSISRALETMEKMPDERDYFTKIAIGASQLAIITAQSIGIPISELQQSVQALSEYGSPADVSQAADRMVNAAKADLDESVIKQAPFDVNNLVFMLDTCIMILSGILIGLYGNEMEDLASKTVDYIRSIVNKSSAENTRMEFQQSRRNYAIEMLRMLDGSRSDPNFYHVYAVFNLEDAERRDLS